MLIKLLSKIYNTIKSTTYFKNLYYAVSNSNYFSNLQEHEKMLNDKTRINTYYQAIQKYVNSGDIVIDLGAGTGILSFMASKKLPKKIFAVEHSKIIESAKIVACHNAITNIEFVNRNSKDFGTTEKADIIIHEQIGALLFDEKMVENVLDLRDRVLKKDGKILHGKFDFFVEPVQITDAGKVPFIWEQNIHGIRFDCLNSHKKDINGVYGMLLIKPDAIKQFVSVPEKILYFDMESMEKESIPKKFKYRRNVLKDCELNGLIVYFNAIFDEEIILTTSPIARTTRAWSIPLLRTEPINFKEGDIIEIDFEMGDPSDINTYKWNCVRKNS